MSFFGKKPKTAQQKAQMAKTRIILRGAALVFLVFYVIVPMINPEIEDVEGMHPALRYGILVFFIAATAALAVVTVLDYFRDKKAGRFEADAYTDDEGIAGYGAVTSEPEAKADGDDDEDYEDDDDDYEEDDED